MGDDRKKVRESQKLLSGEIIPMDEALPATEHDIHRRRSTFVGGEIRAWTRRKAVESTTRVVRAERDLAHAHKEEAEAREGWERAREGHKIVNCYKTRGQNYSRTHETLNKPTVSAN